MKLSFTKMHGAGNDFVVLDETRQLYGLTPSQYRWLADRHMGVGADQILSVRQAKSPDADFAYVIHNADGNEVEHCGNGARCFVRFVREQGLSAQSSLRVEVKKGLIVLEETADHQVRVNMGPPQFNLASLPFNSQGLSAQAMGAWEAWTLDGTPPQHCAAVGVVSMGNPHAVQCVDDVSEFAVSQLGPWVESHPRFPAHVNAGFMQVVTRDRIHLRVYERGAGETLACGTGACAAVVCGIRWGLLNPSVEVLTRGGTLRIEWTGQLQDPVYMNGPAVTVFRGEVEVPDEPTAHKVLHVQNL